jgi:hypothetical protein
VRHGTGPPIKTATKAKPPEKFKNRDSILIFGDAATLASHKAHNVSIRTVEAIQDNSDSLSQPLILETATVKADEIGTRVLEWHGLTLIVQSIASIVILPIVLQAMKHTGEILCRVPITKCDQF